MKIDAQPAKLLKKREKQCPLGLRTFVKGVDDDKRGSRDPQHGRKEVFDLAVVWSGGRGRRR